MRFLSPLMVISAGILTGLIMMGLSPKAMGQKPGTSVGADVTLPAAEDPHRILQHSSSTFPIPTRADWRENPQAHVISLDVPGVKREDITVDVEEKNRVLRINGERKADEEAEGEKVLRAERTFGKFLRQFRLPASADMEAIEAHLGGGVLRVTVLKLAEENKPQTHAVSIAEDDG